MTAPTFTNTWYSRGNVPFPDNTSNATLMKSWLWLLKALLKDEVATGGTAGVRPVGAKWTCVGSSDAVTAGMDGVDRWGAVYDGTKIVRTGTTGVARSWIVLQSPAAMGPVYMCIQYFGSSDIRGDIIFSRTPFTATAGSTIIRPTSTQDISVGTTSVPAAENNIIFGETNWVGGNTCYAHFAITDSGEFHFATYKTTKSGFQAYMFALNAIDTLAGDTHPLWVGFEQNEASTSGAGSAYTNTFSAPTTIHGRTWDGTNIVGGATGWKFGGSPRDGTAAPDVLLGMYGVLPVLLASITSTTGGQRMGWRGRLPDFYLVGSATVGGSFPSTAAPVGHIVGSMLVPFGVQPNFAATNVPLDTYTGVNNPIMHALLVRSHDNRMFNPLGSGPSPAPVISGISPSAGTPIEQYTVINISVTDEADSFRRIILVAEFPNSKIKEVVFDGNGFGPMYTNGYNTQTVIPNGYTFTVLRNNGWILGDGPVLTPFVIDTTGSENA